MPEVKVIKKPKTVITVEESYEIIGLSRTQIEILFGLVGASNGCVMTNVFGALAETLGVSSTHDLEISRAVYALGTIDLNKLVLKGVIKR
jgi:hypothetical protein